MRFGIDYSMTSPACCGYSPESLIFWYAHGTKHSLDSPGVRGIEIPDAIAGDSVPKRAVFLATSLLSWLSEHAPISAPVPASVLIEDYAFNATGRVFHIGENCGILKHLLDSFKFPWDVVPPTVVKKFATGKGNADKHKMTAAFLEAHPIAKTWITPLFPRTKVPVPAVSPLADMADAYWIARYAAERAPMT